MKSTSKLFAAGAIAGILIAAVAAPLAIAQTARTAVPTAATSPTSSPDGVFAAWDKDHNKALSIDEFKAGWEVVRQAEVMRRLQAQFVAMDTNRNGAIDPAEYANLPAIKNSGATAPLMSAFDTNKNQSLNFNEYLGFVDAVIKNAQPGVTK